MNIKNIVQICYALGVCVCMYWFGLLGFNASATARVISRWWNDHDEISFLVEETGVPGGNHRPTASNWWKFSHIRSLPSPGIELGPQRCYVKQTMSACMVMSGECIVYGVVMVCWVWHGIVWCVAYHPWTQPTPRSPTDASCMLSLLALSTLYSIQLNSS